MISNVISDYLSLFMICRCIVIGGRYPLLTLVLGSLVGMIVVLALFLVRNFAVRLVMMYPIAEQMIIWGIVNKLSALI